MYYGAIDLPTAVVCDSFKKLFDKTSPQYHYKDLNDMSNKLEILQLKPHDSKQYALFLQTHRAYV